MSATPHFIAVLSLLRLNKKENKFRETQWKYFWSFWFFEKQSKLKEKEKQKRENYLHGKAPNKQKKNKEIFLGFLLIETGRKEARKYFWVF